MPDNDNAPAENANAASAENVDVLEDIAAIKSHNEEVKGGDAALAAKAAAKADAAKVESNIKILEKKEEESRRTGVRVAAVCAIIFAIIGLALYFKPSGESEGEGQRITMRESNTPRDRGAQQNRDRRSNRNNRGTQNGGDSESEAADEYSDEEYYSDTGLPNKSRIQSHVEPIDAHHAAVRTAAAQAEIPDPVNELRQTISHDPNNMAAWRKLLEIYRDSNQNETADRVERQMKRMFGESILEITDLVSRFGTVERVEIGGGVYRIEYQSEKRNYEELVTETFSITRAVRSMCDCDNVSLFASTGGGRGLLANSQKNTPLESRGAFARRAELVWLN